MNNEHDTKTAGIAIDAWKLPIFEERLTQAGYAFQNCGPLINDTLLLRVRTNDLAALTVVVKTANDACAAMKR